MSINETHDKSLESWVESANDRYSEFPIQNLPFAIFRKKESSEPFRAGVAIGDKVLDLLATTNTKAFDGDMQRYLEVCCQDTLNEFMSLGKRAWSNFRIAISKALQKGSDKKPALSQCLIPQDAVEYKLPCSIGDYTDFYTSIYHATSVGRLFRPDNPLLPNYQWIPIAYHGRSSSIDISGQTFHRPVGQTISAPGEEPLLGPCKRLDYEVEVGIFIGTANDLGERVTIENAESHVFGICLFNDLSARDIQAWEYQPLGPFLSKNFASTISPWIITFEALEPFRTHLHRDETQAHPKTLTYLNSNKNQLEGAFDINLKCSLLTEGMSVDNLDDHVLSESNFKHSYWTIGQMVTHHTVNGCNLNPGDLLGSGTQSSPDEEQAGSLLELTQGGKKEIYLESGESRTFLCDGDTVILRGKCKKEGYRTIGFGECRSTVLPAIAH